MGTTTSEAILNSLYNITYIVGIFLGLEIILIASLSKSKKKITTIFSMVVFGQILWFFTNYFTDNCHTDADAYFWAKLNPIGPMLSLMFFLWFAYLFPGKDRIETQWWKRILVFLLPGILIVFTPTRLHLTSAKCDFWITTGYGPLYPAFMLFSVVYLLIWIPAVLLRKRKEAVDPMVKKQATYMLWGIMSYAVGLLIFSVVIPYATGVDWSTAISPLMPFLFIFAALYSIVQHRLFSGKVVTAEIFSGSVSILTFLNLYFSGSDREAILNSVIFIATACFSIMLVRSVVREVEAKERIAELAENLKKANAEITDFNEHLEDKIKTQTQAIESSYRLEKEAREELERLSASRTSFITTTAARLSEPLATIRTTLERTLRLPADARCDGEMLSGFKGTKDAALTLTSLVNKFLDISQLEVGKGIVNLSPVLLPEIAGELSNEMRENIKKKNVSFSFDLDEKARMTPVLADREKIKKALAGLFENAVRYAPEGSAITIKGSVFPHPIERTNVYTFSITDQGPGMDPEDIKKFFAGSGIQKESGLGISLAREVLRAHGGRIWAASLPGKGLTVSIELRTAQETAGTKA